MTLFIVRRTLIGLSTVVMLSVISFVIIQLPPGDYLDAYAGELQETQTSSNLLDREGMDALRAFYGLDRPLYVQYLKWVANMSRGSFGFSFERNQDVWDAISEELLMTVVLASSTVLFTWAMAIPGQSHFDRNQLWAACDSTSREGGLQTRRYGVSCFRASHG